MTGFIGVCVLPLTIILLVHATSGTSTVNNNVPYWLVVDQWDHKLNLPQPSGRYGRSIRNRLNNPATLLSATHAYVPLRRDQQVKTALTLAETVYTQHQWRLSRRLDHALYRHSTTPPCVLSTTADRSTPLHPSLQPDHPHPSANPYVVTANPRWPTEPVADVRPMGRRIPLPTLSDFTPLVAFLAHERAWAKGGNQGWSRQGYSSSSNQSQVSAAPGISRLFTSKTCFSIGKLCETAFVASARADHLVSDNLSTVGNSRVSEDQSAAGLIYSTFWTVETPHYIRDSRIFNSTKGEQCHLPGGVIFPEVRSLWRHLQRASHADTHPYRYTSAQGGNSMNHVFLAARINSCRTAWRSAAARAPANNTKTYIPPSPTCTSQLQSRRRNISKVEPKQGFGRSWKKPINQPLTIPYVTKCSSVMATDTYHWVNSTNISIQPITTSRFDGGKVMEICGSSWTVVTRMTHCSELATLIKCCLVTVIVHRYISGRSWHSEILILTKPVTRSATSWMTDQVLAMMAKLDEAQKLFVRVKQAAFNKVHDRTEPPICFRPVTIREGCQSVRRIKTKAQGNDGLSVKQIAPILRALLAALTHAVHDKVSTFEMNLRKKSLDLPPYILMGVLSDICPVKYLKTHIAMPQKYLSIIYIPSPELDMWREKWKRKQCSVLRISRQTSSDVSSDNGRFTHSQSRQLRLTMSHLEEKHLDVEEKEGCLMRHPLRDLALSVLTSSALYPDFTPQHLIGPGEYHVQQHSTPDLCVSCARSNLSQREHAARTAVRAARMAPTWADNTRASEHRHSTTGTPLRTWDVVLSAELSAEITEEQIVEQIVELSAEITEEQIVEQIVELTEELSICCCLHGISVTTSTMSLQNIAPCKLSLAEITLKLLS
ncbi:hypothetical protein PR048_000691 [Dryococelus australis]|uniref:Uncharacterized protein n=1 Tax=Dryococelus australis TaxID=614101 RepID=A0ABQ9IGJ8_9NEOP|nr:hypothetical protein PR048_000691 [Dryococelus australis]